MAVRKTCSELGDPPALVYFDGYGLNVFGEYCKYVDPTVGCSTKLVYFDGTGLKILDTTTPEGSSCPAVSNACDFDGTGLKLVNLSGVCTPPG
jgi:hypothetical protein